MKENRINQSEQPVLEHDFVAEFWQVSVEFYQLDAVKSLLLGLQDKHQYSINRLLFSLWFSQLFQQLIDSSLLKQTEPEILLSEESVNNIRQQRRDLELVYAESMTGPLNMVRHHLLEAELSMEKEVQSRLVNLLCDGKYQPLNQISAETLDFLINENISLLNQHRTSIEESKLQQLSMLWIQHQDCYN